MGNDFDKVRNAVRRALADAGVSGELQITMLGMSSTSWLGQPNEGDVLVRVTVDPLEDNSPTANPDRGAAQ